MSQKIRPLIFSVLFLLASIGTYSLGQDYLRPAEPTICSAPTQSVESPAGTWRQYVIHDGQPVYLATFTFVEHDGDFRVVPNDVAPVTFPQEDFRTFEHNYDGKHWSFHSDWHEYGIAWFQLKKVDEGRFEGFAYLDGEQRPNRHILIRVE